MANNISTKSRVLVVDDEPLICDAVRLVLVNDGYEVEVAANGHEALARLDAVEFDLFILDYEMPGMKGDQLAAIIKKRLPRSPIILLSAYGEVLRTAGRPLTGIDAQVDKPFSLEMLRRGMTKALAFCEEPQTA
jgi:CheY-like chemotaxis protein